ncbi:hypothetical protein RhiirC2_845761 [Rhizophagus irregularis]|uniref:Uncharacterized protein n=1 Tax=Rhizophagus irregularis TaxID=588596 RepID=A0A2N1NPA5_9GLOM|nr:hypothetical protein RhiirC2_845761 [Rhizophagus irregularis]
MEKNICVLLSMLALTFFTLQVLAQTITCNSPATFTSQPIIATVSVFDGYYDPDCLTISKQQTVVWGIMASKSYSYNDGPFGSVDNPEINLRGNKEGQILAKTPHTLLGSELFFKCNIDAHCDNGMFAKIVVI